MVFVVQPAEAMIQYKRILPGKRANPDARSGKEGQEELKMKRDSKAYFYRLVFFAAAAVMFALMCQAALADSYSDKADAFISDSRWKNGASYGDNQTPKSYKTSLCYSCYAYTADFVHEVWNVPSGTKDFRPAKVGTKFTDPNEISDGDVIRVSKNGSTHYYVVLKRYSDGTLWTAEGNASDKARVSKKVYSMSKLGTSGGKTFDNGWHMPGYTPFAQPGKPVVSVTTIDDCNETTFTWEPTANTSYYTIRIYNASGEEILLRGGWKKTHFRAYLPEGSYSVKLASVNSDLGIWTFSDEVYFRVYSAPAPAFEEEPEALTVWEGKLYLIYPTRFSWYEAESAASAMGGRLADISCREEQEAVAKIVAEFGGNCWIGAEVFRNNGWRWSSGEWPGFTNWASGEPSSGFGDENCVEIMSETGLWNDRPAYSTNGTSTYNVTGAVVEFDAVSFSSEPAFLFYEEGVTPMAEDFMNQVAFSGGCTVTVPPDEVTLSISGTSAGEQNVTAVWRDMTSSFSLTFAPSFGEGDTFLPAGLETIEEEAFRNCDMKAVRFPDGLKQIGESAFRDCVSLSRVRIPSSVTSIGENAFADCAMGLMIYGADESAAYRFAKAYGYDFVLIRE